MSSYAVMKQLDVFKDAGTCSIHSIPGVPLSNHTTPKYIIMHQCLVTIIAIL